MARLDWKALKDKVKQATDVVSELAKDASQKAVEAWNSEEGMKLRSGVKQIADSAVELAQEASQKAKDTWNSEENLKLRAGVKQIADSAVELAQEASQKAVEVWNSEESMKLREGVMAGIDSVKDTSLDIAQKASDVWNSENVVLFRGKSQKALKVISGIQAVEDRKKSIQTREEADLLKAEIESTNEAIREDLNETLEDFGRYRLESLKESVGRFLHCLEQMNQKAKGKEYEFLNAIDIKTEEVKEMATIEMSASDALRTLAVGGGFAAVGLMGTPVAVTAAVTAMASASTGVAISSLSGAAASNAVLAWLGGGAISAGGGGVAAGTVVLGAVTATATIGLAVVAVGTLASRFYAKKNTEAEAYLAEVKLWAEQTQASWTVLEGVKKRINELHDVTTELVGRCRTELEKLEMIIPVFDNGNQDHVKTFQQCALLAKSMSELATTPILDAEGNINQQAGIIVAKTQKVLNSSL